MIEDIFNMYKRAKIEAACLLHEGNFSGYMQAMVFAFQCRKAAAEMMNQPVVGFEFPS